MFLEYVYTYCQSIPESVYIVEGTQLFMTNDSVFFLDKPLVVVGTSALKSLFQRLDRQLSDEEKKKPFSVGNTHIMKLLKDVRRLQYKDAKKLNRFLLSLYDCKK